METADAHRISSRCFVSPVRGSEAGVGVSVPLPRSSDGRITAVEAQKEIVAARNRRKWTEVGARPHPQCRTCLADSGCTAVVTCGLYWPCGAVNCLYRLCNLRVSEIAAED